MSTRLVLGTRGSELALWQARWVQQLLGGEQTGVRLEVIRTQGDRDLDLDLSSSLDKGLFTKELEEALHEGRIDAAVHSLKDLPTADPEGLHLAAFAPRGDTSDVLLVHPDAALSGAPLGLKEGSSVGTSSPRRHALLAHAAPLARAVTVFRGNVPTRIARCRRREVDAVILARAGLARLRIDPAPLMAFDLEPGTWLPAPGQGAVAVEARTGDTAVLARLAAIDCALTRAATSAERGLLARLGLGCHAALGALARPVEEGYRLDAGRLGEGDAWQSVSVTAATAAELPVLAEAALESAPAATRRPTAAPAAPWW